MRLEGHDAARYAAMLRLIFKQGQHGLVAPVHTVEVANRQGAFGCEPRLAVSAKDFHAPIIVFIAPLAA